MHGQQNIKEQLSVIELYIICTQKFDGMHELGFALRGVVLRIEVQ
jgi:hypothetical protein